MRPDSYIPGTCDPSFQICLSGMLPVAALVADISLRGARRDGSCRVALQAGGSFRLCGAILGPLDAGCWGASTAVVAGLTSYALHPTYAVPFGGPPIT